MPAPLQRQYAELPGAGPANSRGGLPGLLDKLAALHAAGESGVLGVVFSTSGSTYQKPGAIVLLDRGGMRHGAISGGCLEPQLEDAARAACDSGLAQIAEFDTRSDEDLIFGSGSGCRGRIRLLLLPQQAAAPLTQALTASCAAGAALDLNFRADGPEPGRGRAWLRGAPARAPQWRWGSDGRADTGEPEAHTASEEVRLVIQPPPRVLLLGTGPETPPLNHFMHRMGWLVGAVEHRGRWLKFARAANIKDVMESRPGEAAARWREQPFEAAVAMTHNYALDLEHLVQCAASKLSYVGLLGPAARRNALLDEMGEERAAALRGRLHAPVGLGLGGAGPEALALAIVAELQTHFTQRPH